MKSFSINKHLSLKCLFFTCLLAGSLTGISQDRSAILDPSLGRIELTDLAGYQINENYVQPDQLIKLKVPVGVVTHGKAMPAGSCKIKIGLGSKLVIDPLFDMNMVALSNYFKWTSSMNGGEMQVTGELIAALPDNYQEVNVAFKVKGSIGRSTITANFLITNHNTVTILSDEDGTNNMSFLKYNVTTVAAPVPVTTINDVKRTDCSIDVSFGTDQEINLVRYEVEVSKDGIGYEKVGELAATNLSVYNAHFPITKDLQSKILYVRIKSVSVNGMILYSTAKTVDGSCTANWKLDVFPNPASGVRTVVIRAVEGMFNDRYMVSMIDMSGKIVDVKELKLSNVSSFNYELANVAAGKYMIRIINSDGTQSALLNFEKL